MELRTITPVKWDKPDKSRLRAWCHLRCAAIYFLPRRMLEVWDSANNRAAAALARDREVMATRVWEARQLLEVAVQWRRGAANGRCEVTSRRLRAARFLLKAFEAASWNVKTAKTTTIIEWREQYLAATVAAWTTTPAQSSLGDCFVVSTKRKQRKGKHKGTVKAPSLPSPPSLGADVAIREAADEESPMEVNSRVKATGSFRDAMDGFMVQASKQESKQQRSSLTEGPARVEVQHETEEPLMESAIWATVPTYDEAGEKGEDAMWRDSREEWATLLQDLQDMGFEDVQANGRALVTHGGDLTKTIKALVSAERASASL